MRRRDALGALGGLGFAACSESDGGPFPSREIKLIVQASPGGTSDTVSRVMASLAEEDLGVPIICENKPGASGALAFAFVVRRPSDGYTIGHAPVEVAMVRALGFADVGPADMSLICMVSKTPPAFVVQTESRWRTLEEFLAEARQKPGGMILSNSGTGSIWHFNTLLLEERTGVRFTHLPYPGSSQALVSLLGGHVDASVAGVGEVAAHVESGKLRALAVLDEKRTDVFAETPTTYELGLSFGAPAWSGFFGPQGIAEDRVERLAAVFHEAFQSDRWVKLCSERGMTPLYLARDAFQEFALEQQAFFAAELPKLLRMER